MKSSFKLIIISLSLVIVAITSIVAISVFSEKSRNHINYVDAAGRQRMLSQRIAYFAEKSVRGNITENNELHGIIELHDSTLKVLLNGGTVPGFGFKLNNTSDPEIRSLINDTIQPLWNEYKTAALIIANNREEKFDALSIIEEKSAKMLFWDNQLVKKYAAYSIGSEAMTKKIIVAIILINIIIVGLIFTVFQKYFKAKAESDIEKQKNKGLEKNLDFRKNFLAEISHEIRTPLNGILGLSDYALNNQLEQKEVKHHLSTIKESANQLDLILANVLNVSRIERGKIELYKEAVNIDDMIKSTIHLFKQMAESKNIKITYQNLNQNNNAIITDGSKIRQILNNLISNAIKYSNDGTITVSLERSENTNELILKVKDQGIGMTKAELENLSNIFTRFDTTELNQQADGTGLGIWITKNIINALNGELNVYSEKGKGSTFTVNIPVEIANEEELLSSNENISAQSVAIVDDRPLNLKVAGLIMDSIGIKSSKFESGQALLDSGEKDFDVYFLDIEMPQMNGFELLKALRKAGIKKPVVALTANSYEGFYSKIKENGFDYLLSKPISIEKTKTCFAELEKGN